MGSSALFSPHSLSSLTISSTFWALSTDDLQNSVSDLIIPSPGYKFPSIDICSLQGEALVPQNAHYIQIELSLFHLTLPSHVSISSSCFLLIFKMPSPRSEIIESNITAFLSFSTITFRNPVNTSSEISQSFLASLSSPFFYRLFKEPPKCSLGLLHPNHFVYYCQKNLFKTQFAHVAVHFHI